MTTKVMFSRKDERKALLMVSSIIHNMQRLSSGVKINGHLIAEIWESSHMMLKLPPTGYDYILEILRDKDLIILKRTRNTESKSQYGDIIPKPKLREFWQQLEEEGERERRDQETLNITKRQDKFNRIIAVTGSILAIQSLISIWELTGVVLVKDTWFYKIIIFGAIILIIASLAYLGKFVIDNITED